MPKTYKPMLLTAALDADPEHMRQLGLTEPGMALQLESAGEQLSQLLDAHRETALSRQIRTLIDEQKLLYVVGPWPPQQTGQSRTVPQPICPTCKRRL